MNKTIKKVEDSYRHKGLRRQLIAKLKEKGIKDEKVLAAIGKIPRHVFFDQALLEHAYQDKAFPIGAGQTISQPYTVAFQTQLLQVDPDVKTLEIGTGSGYQCWVLVEAGARVFTVEREAELYKKAKKTLSDLNVPAHFFLSDGTLGLPSHAPFDRILVTAGAPDIPEMLTQQLKPGGIMVIPVGDSRKQKMIRIFKNSTGTLKLEEHGEFRFVPLKGKGGWK